MRIQQDETVRVDYTPPQSIGQDPTIYVHRQAKRTVLPSGEQRLVVFPASLEEAAVVQQKMSARRGIAVGDVEELVFSYPAATFVGDERIEYSDLILGAVKIAYEFAHYWLGEPYQSDPVGESIRQYIASTLTSRVRPTEQPQELLALKWLYRDEWFPARLADRPEHVAVMANSSSGGTVCIYRLFNVLAAAVLVTRHPERYQNAQWNDALILDPLARTVTRSHRRDIDTHLQHIQPYVLERSEDNDTVRLRLLGSDGKEIMRVSGDED